MWSSEERLRTAVQTRLRAVLEPGLGQDCPPLEPRVRTVLEQRLDSAALDLVELMWRGENSEPVPVEHVKTEVKQEPQTPDLNIVRVKVEQEEQEIHIQFSPDYLLMRNFQIQDQSQDQDQAEPLRYCPECGSSLEPRSVKDLPPLPLCSVCGRSRGQDLLLLEHNYTHDRSRDAPELRDGFRCSVCGRDFSQVGALLEHMSQHLFLGRGGEGELDNGDSEEVWSFEDDAFNHTETGTICSICGDAFTETEQLQEHLRSHLR